jgi:hypothetical protein
VPRLAIESVEVLLDDQPSVTGHEHAVRGRHLATDDRVDHVTDDRRVEPLGRWCRGLPPVPDRLRGALDIAGVGGSPRRRHRRVWLFGDLVRWHSPERCRERSAEQRRLESELTRVHVVLAVERQAQVPFPQLDLAAFALQALAEQRGKPLIPKEEVPSEDFAGLALQIQVESDITRRHVQ